MTLSALIFDVDGTLAETEPSHLKAMNGAFEALNLPWRWSRDQYRVLLETPGRRPRVLGFLRGRMKDEDTSVLEDLARRIHLEKDLRYRALVAAGAIQLRPGVKRLIEEARAAGLALAVATVTGRGNLEALLRHAGGTEGWFGVVCTDEDAPRRKPAPDIYLRTIEKLGLPADACLAVEDSVPGAKSAQAAGLPMVITESSFTRGDRFDGAVVVLSDLGEPDRAMRVVRGSAFGKRFVDVDLLRRWHVLARADPASRIP